jgi:hypothetical protein
VIAFFKCKVKCILQAKKKEPLISVWGLARDAVFYGPIAFAMLSVLSLIGLLALVLEKRLAALKAF